MTYNPGFSVGQLQSFIHRIERLEEEKKAIAEDIKEVFAEVKGEGFDLKVVREVLRLRKIENSDRQEHETVLNTYLNALGEMPTGGYKQEAEGVE